MAVIVLGTGVAVTICGATTFSPTYYLFLYVGMEVVRPQVVQAFFFALVGQSRYVLFVCVLSVGACLLLVQASYVLEDLVIHVIHAPGSADCWGRTDCGVLSGRALACWVVHGSYGFPSAGVSGLRDSPGSLGDGPRVHSWGRVCCWSCRVLHLPGGALWISPVRWGVG